VINIYLVFSSKEYIGKEDDSDEEDGIQWRVWRPRPKANNLYFTSHLRL